MSRRTGKSEAGRTAVGRAGRSCVTAGIALLIATSVLEAQQAPVRWKGRAERPAEKRLQEFLAADSFQVWDSDTVLAAAERVEGGVLVLGASVRVEGELGGSVFVVDGDIFLRPGSQVVGDLTVLGGGYYGSSMATLGGALDYEPNERYRISPLEGGWVIEAVREQPKALEFHGLHGFGAPTYQRVNSLTLSWGATARAVKWAWMPSLEFVARFHTSPGEFEGTVRQFWHPSRDFEFGLEGERVTRTNEAWARAAVSNSLSYLFIGDDFRDYYSADRGALVLRRSPAATWSPRLAVGWEKARSLDARDLFVLFGSEGVRENPRIDDGETWSARLGLDITRQGSRSRLEVGAMIEAADSSIAGDFSFVLGEATVRWILPAVAGHRVDLFAIVRGDLAGRLPAQRESGFGGRATLPTLPVLARRGPRILFGQAAYLIPIAFVSLGPLGNPEALIRVATGTTWQEGESAVFDTNLVGGLRLSYVEAALAVDPRSGGDVAFYAIVRFPGDL